MLWVRVQLPIRFQTLYGLPFLVLCKENVYLNDPASTREGDSGNLQDRKGIGSVCFCQRSKITIRNLLGYFRKKRNLGWDMSLLHVHSHVQREALQRRQSHVV